MPIFKVCIHYYRNLVPHTDPKYLSALYGMLASEILVQVSIFICLSFVNRGI